MDTDRIIQRAKRAVIAKRREVERDTISKYVRGVYTVALETLKAVEALSKVVETVRKQEGPEGKQGIQGPKGERGERGERGPVGPKGDRGERGERGPRGEKGDIGLRGRKGEQGERGEKGEKGDAGEDGKDGSPDTPSEIVKKINSLRGNRNKIDASRIKNLPRSGVIGSGFGRANVVSSDPSSASNGDLIYNTTDEALKIWIDGAWVEIGTGGGAPSNIYGTATYGSGVYA